MENSKRYYDVEIEILRDLNELRSKERKFGNFIDSDFNYREETKKTFDSVKYKKYGGFEIEISLANLLDYEHIKGRKIPPIPEEERKYKNLIEGDFKITDYGRTMIDLNNFGGQIYEKYTELDEKYKNLDKDYTAKNITLLALFAAIFSFIVTISKDITTIPPAGMCFIQAICWKFISTIVLAIVLVIFISAIYWIFKR